MEFKSILYETRDRIAFITLNRPDRLNALTVEMVSELRDVWKHFRRDKEAWVAVVSGAGKGFCAGLDLREMQEGGWLPDFWGPLHFDIWKPVIVAINGPCVGGGMDFASECDIVIASEEAFFMDSHVSIGLVSAHEGLQMARRLPFPVALRMALVGNHERLTARRAYELGFVTEIHPREELNAAAQRIAEAILSNAPLAVRGTKELLIRGQHQSLSEAMILAERIRRDNTRTEDIREGPRAFVEKRKPVWKAK